MVLVFWFILTVIFNNNVIASDVRPTTCSSIADSTPGCELGDDPSGLPTPKVFSPVVSNAVIGGFVRPMALDLTIDVLNPVGLSLDIPDSVVEQLEVDPVPCFVNRRFSAGYRHLMDAWGDYKFGKMDKSEVQKRDEMIALSALVEKFAEDHQDLFLSNALLQDSTKHKQNSLALLAEFRQEIAAEQAAIEAKIQ